jgi:hypothetical protein
VPLLKDSHLGLGDLAFANAEHELGQVVLARMNLHLVQQEKDERGSEGALSFP